MHKERQFSCPHQLRQQKSIFGPGRYRVKDSTLNVRLRTSNSKSSGIQVANATVRLERVTLDGLKPQLLCSADQTRAISDEVELKKVVLGRRSDSPIQRSQTVCFQPGISVHKKQDRASRNPGASISGGGDSVMRLCIDD